MTHPRKIDPSRQRLGPQKPTGKNKPQTPHNVRYQIGDGQNRGTLPYVRGIDWNEPLRDVDDPLAERLP